MKRYGRKTVVDHVRLSIEEGQIVGVLGPNGSGKTTMIRMICALPTPDEGQGTVLGRNLIGEAEQIRREVGYMTRKFSFNEDLTIAENLQFVARLYERRPVSRHVDRVLEELGLGERRHDLAGMLSGGWKQRLALAACVMHRPRLLLLAGPTAGADPQARREFRDRIHMLAAGGITVLFSTHYMDEATRCNRISYILHGHMLIEGEPEQIVAGSGLHAIDLEGQNLAKIAGEFRGHEAVARTTIFGNVLHIVGHDPEAMQRLVRPLASAHGLSQRQASPTIEDVFIELVERKGAGQ